MTNMKKITPGSPVQITIFSAYREWPKCPDGQEWFDLDLSLVEITGETAVLEILPRGGESNPENLRVSGPASTLIDLTNPLAPESVEAVGDYVEAQISRTEMQEAHGLEIHPDYDENERDPEFDPAYVTRFGEALDTLTEEEFVTLVHNNPWIGQNYTPPIDPETFHALKRRMPAAVCNLVKLHNMEAAENKIPGIDIDVDAETASLLDTLPAHRAYQFLRDGLVLFSQENLLKALAKYPIFTLVNGFEFLAPEDFLKAYEEHGAKLREMCNRKERSNFFVLFEYAESLGAPEF